MVQVQSLVIFQECPDLSPFPPEPRMHRILMFSILFCQLAVDVLDTPFDLCVTCPVIIGSIPLRSIVEQYLPNYQAQPITDQPAANGGPLLSNIRKSNHVNLMK